MQLQVATTWRSDGSFSPSRGGIASQMVVGFTYIVEIHGYELYPWLVERGSRSGSNAIAGVAWLVICLLAGAAAFFWGSGQRTILMRVAGWFLIVIGGLAGTLTFVGIAAGAGYAGVDPGVYLLLALVPAVPIVPGVLLLMSSRDRDAGDLVDCSSDASPDMETGGSSPEA